MGHDHNGHDCCGGGCGDHAHFEPSEALIELLEMGFERAFDSLEEESVIVPFALVARGEEVEVHEFEAEDYEQAVENGRDALRTLEPVADIVLMAFDGFVENEEGQEIDAVLIEVQEKGQPAMALCMTYRPAEDDEPLEVLDDAPAILGEAESLMKA
ncbi:MAG: hypothetical protein RBS39_08655 [Phycisphaerales bacterium]|jgi:hypothetical protein|nr:hypothetical protein [Phycisphaerales bacterium]